MTDFGAMIQDAVLSALSKASGRHQQPLLESLQAALGELRMTYWRSEPPDFSRGDMRAAYALAYFPHHAAAAAVAYGASGTALLGLDQTRHAVIVVLGAGPGPEVIGLVRAMRNLGQDTRLTFHLVDREPGWRATRRATIGAVLAAMSHEGCVELHEHVVDLADPAQLAKISPMVAGADLVVCETLLTELEDPSRDGQLIDRLGEWLGPEGRLMIIDIQPRGSREAGERRTKGGRKVRDSRTRLDSMPGLVLRVHATQNFPASDPIPPLSRFLFSKDPKTNRIRRKHLPLELFLYSRPEVELMPTATKQGFDPTPSQTAALAAFDRFLSGDGRIFTLTGAAGTGKTALFGEMVRRVQKAELPAELMAPTGQAARRLARLTGLGVSTVHSAIYMWDETEYPEEKTSGEDDDADRAFNLEPTTAPAERKADRLPVAFFRRREPAPEPAIHFVDEASLIGNRSRADADTEVIFGDGRLLADLVAYAVAADGSRLVLVGDREQLPPVGESEPVALLPDRMAEITGHAAETTELTGIVRQTAESHLRQLATRAREATIRSGIDLSDFDTRHGVKTLSGDPPASWFEACGAGKAIVVAARNSDIARWNRRIRAALGRSTDAPVARDRVSMVRGSPLYDVLNGDDLVIEGVGDDLDVVAAGRNDQVRLRNVRFRYEQVGVGSIVFTAPMVEDLLWDSSRRTHASVTRTLFVDFKRRTHHKPRSEAFEQAYREDERVNALRVNYSYARTCHRAQGGEWPEVLVDFNGSRFLGSSFGRWAYTAVTRAKRGVWLVNLPRGSGPMDSDTLVSAAAEILAAAGFDLEHHQPIQSGAQLTVARHDQRGRFNLFQKKGRPSKLTATGREHPDFTPELVALFERWTRGEATAHFGGLPEPLESFVSHLVTRLQDDGYDIEHSVRAEYQIGFVLSSEGARAESEYYFNSDGRLTALAGEKRGAMDLLEVLTGAVGF